jgi:hypothetical protein
MAMGAYETSLLDRYLGTLVTPPYTPIQKSQSIHLYAAKYLNPVTRADVNNYLVSHNLPTIPP